MALLDDYTTETIFNDSVKIGRNEKDVEFAIDKEKYIFKIKPVNYEWLVVNPNCKKGIIKLLRQFLSQMTFTQKHNKSYTSNFILFLMRIIKIYKVNYYFNFIKNLVINYCTLLKDNYTIMEYSSSCESIKNMKLFEIILSIPKKSAKYRNPLIQSCCCNNTQLRDYYYKKIQFGKNKINYDFNYNGLDKICFENNLKQIKWFVEHVTQKCMSSKDIMDGYAFKKIYESACRYGRINIVKWLIKKNIFTAYPTINKIPADIILAEKSFQIHEPSIEKTKIIKNKIVKIIINHFIDANIEIKDLSIFIPAIELIVFSKNIRLLEKILLFEPKNTTTNEYLSRVIIQTLFYRCPIGEIITNKIFSYIFNMCVRYGIFKINNNKKIIGSAIKDYQYFINEIFMSMVRCDKNTIKWAVQFGANNFTKYLDRMTDLAHNYNIYSVLYNQDNIVWFKNYVYKKKGIKL
jgi:hypothetical protein